MITIFANGKRLPLADGLKAIDDRFIDDGQYSGQTVSDLARACRRLMALVHAYQDDHNDRTHEGCDGEDNGCYCTICDRAVALVGERGPSEEGGSK